jgi:hypothetical protein
VNGILLEVDDQSFSIEVALVVCVHLNALITIGTLVNDTVLLKDFLNLSLVGIARKVGDIDGAVLLDLGLLVRLECYC